LKEFVSAAIDHLMDKDEDKIGIYEKRPYLGWAKCNSKNPRTMESVILDDTIK